MLNTYARFSLVIALLAASACTQEPAEIMLKGQNDYGRNAPNNYASNASAPIVYSSTAPTAQSAQVQSIGVSDLSPPSHNSSAVADVTPFQKAHPETLKPAAGGDNINQWTGTPHSDDASSALDQAISKSAPQAQNAKAAPLDTIVANSDTSVKKSAAANAPAKLAKADTSAGIGKFIWPVGSKKIISQFGPKGDGKVNDGINIASSDGEPVWAAADGEVVYVGNELQGYGNMVLIKHNGDKSTTYAHLSRATVDKYDRVKQGDIIGYVGSSGNVKEPQLHFAVRSGKDPVDPLKYLSSSVASLK